MPIQAILYIVLVFTYAALAVYELGSHNLISWPTFGFEPPGIERDLAGGDDLEAT